MTQSGWRKINIHISLPFLHHVRTQENSQSMFMRIDDNQLLGEVSTFHPVLGEAGNGMEEREWVCPKTRIVFRLVILFPSDSIWRLDLSIVSFDCLYELKVDVFEIPSSFWQFIILGSKRQPCNNVHYDVRLDVQLHRTIMYLVTWRHFPAWQIVLRIGYWRCNYYWQIINALSSSWKCKK